MIEITRPLMTLCTDDGDPIEGVTRSSSEVEAMEKASILPDGTYLLKRPTATIIVDTGVVNQPIEPPTVETPVVVTPPNVAIPFGDVAALQALGLLPEYRSDIAPPVNADSNINWTGTAGERDEIGLMPEDHAAFIAGHDYLLPGILAAVAPPNLAVIAHSHKPNAYWLPFLMTGDVSMIAHMEAVAVDQELEGNIAPSVPGGKAGYYYLDRYLAWTLRDLAQLAFLQSHGLTERDCYIDQLEASRLNIAGLIDGTRDIAYGQNYIDVCHRFRIFGLNYHAGFVMWGFSPWMESFVGIGLCHVTRLSQAAATGFGDWLSVTAWHGEGMLRRSGDAWPFKAIDNYDNWFKRYWDKHTAPTSYTEAAALLPDINWGTLTPYEGEGLAMYNANPDGELMPIVPILGNPEGKRLGHYTRAQHAYHWAEGLAQLGVAGTRERADKLYTAINNRDGLGWDVKNALVNKSSVSAVDPPDLIPEPDPTPVDPIPVEPIPMTTVPAWRVAIQANTWGEIPTANVLNDIRPALDPAINPNHPSAPEWGGAFENMMGAWCGGCIDQVGVTFWIPIGGGHADYGGNEPYKLKLDVASPAWERVRLPTGALPGAVVTNDGQEASGIYADGRLRAIHTYNSLDYIPGSGPVILHHRGAWRSGQTSSGKPALLDESGELIQHGVAAPANTGGSGIYDPTRHCLWTRPAGTGKYGKYDIALDIWTRHGPNEASVGVVGMAYIPEHDLIFVSRWNDWWVFDPTVFTETKIVTSGTGIVPPTRDSQNPVLANGAIWLWENDTDTEKLTKLTIPTNPKTDVWALETITPNVANTVIPTAKAANGTFGRFQYVEKLDGLMLINSVTQKPFFYALSNLTEEGV